MAFGGLEKKQTAAPMAEINMTPLIDVMLVLLVIFIITAPLFTHAIRLDLPKVAAAPARQTPQTISLSIDAAGKLYWNGTVITLEQMRARFVEAGKAAGRSAGDPAARRALDALRGHRAGDGRGAAGRARADRFRDGPAAAGREATSAVRGRQPRPAGHAAERARLAPQGRPARHATRRTRPRTV